MKNKTFSTFGSGQTKDNRRERKPEVRVWMQPFSDPDERQTFLEKLHISSQFSMRYRGLLEFYGDDLIAYKQENSSNKRVNEFLLILAKHLTDNLEENSPTSWQECLPSFWEELIFSHYPSHMKVTTKQNESKLFLQQLKRFFRWLDRRAGTSWFSLIKKYAEEAAPELQKCEHLLNYLYLCNFPRMHYHDWNYKEDLATLEKNFKKYNESVNSVFQVTEVYQEVITVNDIDSGRTYQVVGLPCKRIVPGMLIRGTMGVKKDDLYWTWHRSLGVFPSKAKDFFVFID